MIPRSASLRVLAALAAVGLAVSVYLTIAHYTATPLACPQNGIVNCDLVTRSSYGLVPGTAIPTSAAGLLWFAVALVVSLRERPFGSGLDRAFFAWVLAGLLAVFYLVWAEFKLAHLCEWCTVAHVMVVGSALVATARLSPAVPVDDAVEG